MILKVLLNLLSIISYVCSVFKFKSLNGRIECQISKIPGYIRNEKSLLEVFSLKILLTTLSRSTSGSLEQQNS